MFTADEETMDEDQVLQSMVDQGDVRPTVKLVADFVTSSSHVVSGQERDVQEGFCQRQWEETTIFG